MSFESLRVLAELVSLSWFDPDGDCDEAERVAALAFVCFSLRCGFGHWLGSDGVDLGRVLEHAPSLVLGERRYLGQDSEGVRSHGVFGELLLPRLFEAEFFSGLWCEVCEVEFSCWHFGSVRCVGVGADWSIIAYVTCHGFCDVSRCDVSCLSLRADFVALCLAAYGADCPLC